MQYRCLFLIGFYVLPLLLAGCDSGPDRDELGLPPPEVSFGNSVRGQVEVLEESLRGESGRGDVRGFCEAMIGAMEGFGAESGFTPPEGYEDEMEQIVQKLQELQQNCESGGLTMNDAQAKLAEIRQIAESLPKQAEPAP